MLVQFTFEWTENNPEFVCDSLSDSVSTIGWQEGSKESLWVIEGVTIKQACSELALRLEILSTILETTPPQISFKELEDRDWVAENQRSFPSLEIGCFYIYGTHIKETPPKDKIAILLDATAAFGSGHHESTKGCLLAIDSIGGEYSFQNPIDIGCGSGILSIAMAKRFNSSVTACDNDPDSVRITIENAILNGVTNLHAFLSEGLSSLQLKKRAPYDLVVANILALPLCHLAPQIAKSVKNGAFVILSGLLNGQKEEVEKAYTCVGFIYKTHYTLGEWTTLILKREAM